MRSQNTWFACARLFVVLGALALASPLQAQAPGPRVTVVNPSSQPVPVAIVDPPTINANVSGDVSIVGTPTVNANVSGDVSIIGTPTVNANVSGAVSIVGTPSVDIGSMPGVTPGFYTAICTFAGPFCQVTAHKEAAPGTAFRIDAIQGRTFGSATPDLSALMSLGIVTPGLSTQYEVPCLNVLGFASCISNPGIHVTSFEGLFFSATGLPSGSASARVTVFYTVVKLAP